VEEGWVCLVGTIVMDPRATSVSGILLWMVGIADWTMDGISVRRLASSFFFSFFFLLYIYIFFPSIYINISVYIFRFLFRERAK